MSDPQEQPWSNNPDAPKIPYYLYDTEKATLAGSFLSSILYGMLVVLCFKCISALLNPIHHKGEGVKRGLVSCTVATFSFATVYTAISLDTQSVAFIDNREFTDPNGALLGPLGYRAAIDFAVLGVIPYLMFILNNLLADGLLVYRCHVIYATNPWVIAFPCLVYLAAVAMGIVTLVHQTFGSLDSTHIIQYFGIPYLSLSAFLNVFLTFMIVVQLVLHGGRFTPSWGLQLESADCARP